MEKQSVSIPILIDRLFWVQAFCRNIQYKHLPPEQVTAAPEAKWFPGLAPAGTAPLGEVTVMVGTTGEPLPSRVHIPTCMASSLLALLLAAKYL
jgi:hypothetical protein